MGHTVGWWGGGKILERKPDLRMLNPGSVKGGYVVTEDQWQKEGAVVTEMKNWLGP